MHGLPNYFDGFKRRDPQAFRHYFLLHNYRIYCYLLQLSRDRVLARELTQNAFIILFYNPDLIKDEDHLLRRLYLNARVGYVLGSKGKLLSMDLEVLAGFSYDDTNIMEDADIARNETLISLQTAMQKLPPAKREVAELYFFSGLSVSAIAKLLGLEEQSVREYLSQCLKRLCEELSGKDVDQNNFSVIKG